MTTTNTAAAVAPAAEGVTVTKLSAGRARGVTSKTAPQTTAKVTRGQKAMGMTNAPKKGKPVDAPAKAKGKAPVAAKGKAKDKAPAAPAVKGKAGATFTSVDIAAEQGINAKTLRARIRRNIDRWAPLFVNGEKHVFADNATTRKAVAALLAD